MNVANRLKGTERDEEDSDLADPNMRVVISAPDKNMALEKDDIAIVLVQYDGEEGARDLGVR
jgi:hypothetical protein